MAGGAATGAKIISGKWVWKNKLGELGQVLKNKSRWVARGFTQIYGLNYTDTFAVNEVNGVRGKYVETMWMTPSSTLSSRCDLPMGESRPGKQDKSISCLGGLCANSLGSESLYCTD
jgi:hypothetical protein